MFKTKLRNSSKTLVCFREPLDIKVLNRYLLSEQILSYRTDT
jgi:hypothetical protein